MEFEIDGVTAQWTIMIELMDRLRQLPSLRGAVFVVAVESDMNPALPPDFRRATSEPEVAARLGTVLYLYENRRKPDWPGVFKGQNGDLYKRAADELIMSGRLRVADDVVCAPENSLATLVKQMRAYERTFRAVPTDPVRHNPDPRWSGKHSGPDDVLVAALTAIFWGAHFLGSTRYHLARARRPGRTLAGVTHVVRAYTEKTEERGPATGRGSAGPPRGPTGGPDFPAP